MPVFTIAFSFCTGGGFFVVLGFVFAKRWCLTLNCTQISLELRWLVETVLPELIFHLVTVAPAGQCRTWLPFCAVGSLMDGNLMHFLMPSLPLTGGRI